MEDPIVQMVEAQEMSAEGPRSALMSILNNVLGVYQTYLQPKWEIKMGIQYIQRIGW